MKKLTLLVTSLLALSGIGAIQASVLTTSSSTGLGAVGITPVYTLSFDNAPGLTTNSVIGSQFSFAGVTFSSPAFYDGNSGGINCSFANMGGDCVTNFTTNAGSSALTSGPTIPFSILFSTPQSYAAFALVTAGTGQNNTSLVAYRNGVVVDSASFTTTTSGVLDYVGFYGETTGFDRITINTASPGLIIIDNLQLSSVPEPGTIGMLGLGLGGVVAFARRKRRSA